MDRYDNPEINSKRAEFISEVKDIVRAAHTENLYRAGYLVVTATPDFTLHMDTPLFHAGEADINGEYYDNTNQAEYESDLAAYPVHTIKTFHTIFKFQFDGVLVAIKENQVIPGLPMSGLS